MLDGGQLCNVSVNSKDAQRMNRRLRLALAAYWREAMSNQWRERDWWRYFSYSDRTAGHIQQQLQTLENAEVEADKAVNEEATEQSVDSEGGDCTSAMPGFGE